MDISWRPRLYGTVFAWLHKPCSFLEHITEISCWTSLVHVERCQNEPRMQVGLAWASWASVPFIGGSVSPARRALAVFPLLLLYTTMGWLALIKG